MTDIKIASTIYPVLDVIKNRWSARSFSHEMIAKEKLATLFEAAGWAASANNDQPWQYFYAIRNTEGFQKIFNCLWQGNQPWAKDAAVLIAAVARTSFEKDQAPNAWAVHDLGMANAQLLLQATALNIYCHPMAGFDKAMLTGVLKLKKEQDAVCVIAVGYIGKAAALEEPFKSRETEKRKRKTISEYAFKL